MDTPLIKAFEIAAKKLIQENKGCSNEDRKTMLKQLAHQFMLNEFGFNYQLEMEFNDDILNVYQALNPLY